MASILAQDGIDNGVRQQAGLQVKILLTGTTDGDFNNKCGKAIYFDSN